MEERQFTNAANQSVIALAMSFASRTRRNFVRQPRAVLALVSITTLALTVLGLYRLRHRDDRFLPESWDFGLSAQWDWKQIASEWKPKLEVQIEGLHEEEHEAKTWDLICHEAIDRNLKVAVYDFTPFHDGESFRPLYCEISFSSFQEVVGSIVSSLNDIGVETDLYRKQQGPPEGSEGFS